MTRADIPVPFRRVVSDWLRGDWNHVLKEPVPADMIALLAKLK